MSVFKENQLVVNEIPGKQWQRMYMLGSITAIVVLIGNLLDIIISVILGGDISTLPPTAVDRFAQFDANWLLGLYNLDLLNVSVSIIMIPTFLALCAVHRRVNPAYSTLALLVFSIGTAIFITNNTALPMLALSSKYSAATTEVQKTMLAAAGEAMLARGAHGSPGAFWGFALSLIASMILSFVMLKGKIFSKITAYMGISASILLLVYIIFATFVPEAKDLDIIYMPGGLLAMMWAVFYTVKLFQLSRQVKG